MTRRADDSNLFTGFRGYLAYANPGHRFEGVPLAIAESVLGRVVGIGYSGYWSDFAIGEDTGSFVVSGIEANNASTVFNAAQAEGRSQRYGALRLGPVNAVHRGIEVQAKSSAFRYQKGKRMWMFARLALASPGGSTAHFGLASTTATFLGGLGNTSGARGIPGIDDGIYFHKIPGETRWDFTVRQNNGETRRTQMPATALGSETYQEIGFHVDLDGRIHVYVDEDEQTTALVEATDANIPDDTELRLSFGVGQGPQALPALQRTLDLDWIVAVQEN